MKNRDLKILIADDDEDDVFLIRELIREGFPDCVPRIDWAATGGEAFSLIEKVAYDVCLFDFRLGEINGIELLRRIREKGYSLPIIFLTGRGDQEIAVKAMKAGATDYLGKGSLLAEVLSQSICNAIKLHREEGQRKMAEKTLHSQDRLLQAVSDATHCLLTRRDHAAAIEEALSILGKAMDGDCAFLYQNVDRANEPPGFVECFAWKKQSFSTPFPNGLFPEQSYEEMGLQAAYEEFLAGHSVTLRIQDFPPEIRSVFSDQNLYALTLVPIIMDGAYWGFIAFGDSRSERRWLGNEESMLKAVAASIGSEIKRHTEEEAFHSIVKGTSSRVGDDFFRSLVRHLALALPVRNAYVSELMEYDSNECSILAGWEGGEFLSNQILEVKNTPYEEVMAGMMAFHSDGVQEQFVGDTCLAGLHARSYAAVPCFDSHCKIIGHLSVMDDKPMKNKQRTLSILKVFAARAGAELERKRTEGMIRNMAYHDALTGLPNRVLLSDRLEMALAQAQRSQNMLAVLFLDFDHFKEINDTLGHAVGDQLLKGVAGRLKKCLRNQDTVARLGGDEFILLLPEINSPTDAGNLAQKLLDVVRSPFHLHEHELKITLSIGVALYPRDGETSNILMKHADEALYLAKNQGKNCYQFFKTQRVETIP
ncbi:MAG: diguanylate cyclase domain-containing protein [Nitrospinaceae bacterium]